MNKLYDCFLFNDEFELLELRLKLLDDVVDNFVVVCAKETFTGKTKTQDIRLVQEFLEGHGDNVKLVVIDALEGGNAWEREAYSRNRISDGLVSLSESDLVMISDIDEIPRPSILAKIKADSTLSGLRVLGLDYFNFKFNYKQIHGLQAIWAGPVISRFDEFTCPQDFRDRRWGALQDSNMLIEGAGWHFSFLTNATDVSNKLSSFSHQESEVQNRRDNVTDLLKERHGFHDHTHAGSVWAVVELEDYRCESLADLVSRFPKMIWSGGPDDQEESSRTIKRAIHRLHLHERQKVIRWCTAGEIGEELGRRFRNTVRRVLKFPW
jgi:beta-1,4-mannosyl-glycoprotein beta-1,4-N-acetylglucosaminyltransferase